MEMSRNLLLLALILSTIGSLAQAAGPSITFERTNMMGSEGDIFSFHLIAIGTFNDDFSVEVMVEPLTATPLSDYALVANPLGNTTLAHFTVGQTNSSMVMIILTNDNSWEPQECFTARIVIPPGVEAMLGSPASTRICISDDDEVEIHFMEDRMMVNEGDVMISLQLQAEGIYTSGFRVSVSCLDIFPVEAKVSGRRNNETDAYPSSHSVQFSDLGSLESLSTKITMNITDDLLSEPTECFICLILRPSATRGINVKDPDTLTVCIQDNDVLPVCFAKNEYNGIEGNSVTVQLKATGEFVQPFKARIFSSTLHPEHPFKTVEADEGEDYISPRDVRLNGGIVEFDPGLGQGSTELSLVLVDDDIVEKMEYFRLNFAFEEDPNNPSPIALSKCSPDDVLVAIQDNDEMFVRFERDEYQVDENSGLVNVRLQAVQVEPPNTGRYIPAKYSFDFNDSLITLAESAKAPSDFLNKTGVVTFSSGMEFSSNFTVNLVDNDESECLKTLTVEFTILEIMAQVKVLDSNTATVNIKDDDLAFLSFAVNSANVKEGEDTSITLTVMSNNTFQEDQIVGISVMDGEAESPTDYVLITTMATLPAGQTEFTVVINITDNHDVEEEETFTVELNLSDSLMDCGGRIGVNGSVTITIEDNDAVFIRVKGGAKRVVGEDGSFISFQLEVVNGTVFNEFSVNTIPMESTPVSAQNLMDFTTIGGVLEAVFAVGANISTETRITIVEDIDSDCDETFQVNVSLPSDLEGVFLLEPTIIDVVIMDNDPAFLSFTVDSANVKEGEDTSIMLTVMSSNTFQEDQIVGISAMDGEAESPTDYVLITTMATLPAGQTEFTVVINITDNRDVEEEETFMVELNLSDSLMDCGGRIGVNGSVTITIEDNDAVFIRVKGGAKRVVGEDDSFISFQLEVVNGTVVNEFSVNTIPMESTPVSAQSLADFTTIGGVLEAVIAVGANTSTETRITIVGDTHTDCDETFQVNVSLPPDLEGVFLLEPTTIDVVIMDNDPVELMFNRESFTVIEGSSLIIEDFYLVVTNNFERDQEIAIVAFNGTASSGSDFNLLTTSVTIKAFTTRSESIRIMIVNDTIVEDEEMFQLGVVLSDELLSCGVELGDPSVVNVTIEDDDPVYVGLNLRRIPRTIREGNGSAVVQLEVENGTVFFPINVTVTVKEIGMGPGSALEFLDFYVFGDENLARFERFNTVSTSAEIRTVDNEICEDDEDFEIQISIDQVKQPRVTLVEPTTLRLTIEDDDTENCFLPTVVSFTSDVVRIVERGKKYRLRVHRIGRLEKDLTIKVITEELTATEGEDFIVNTKSIRFRKTSSSYGQANIRYTVPDKDGEEPREAFRIVLEAPDGVMIRQADVTIIITDKS